MGNQITRDYDIQHQIGSGGPGNAQTTTSSLMILGHLWKVCSATRRSTGQAVTAFIFEKKYFDGKKLAKKDQAAILDCLIKEVCSILMA